VDYLFAFVQDKAALVSQCFSISDHIEEIDNSLEDILQSTASHGLCHCRKFKSHHHCQAIVEQGGGTSTCGVVICAICSSSLGNEDGIIRCSGHSSGEGVAVSGESVAAWILHYLVWICCIRYAEIWVSLFVSSTKLFS